MAQQHTWEGTITIRQQSSRADIINPQTDGDVEQQDLGFGLGLQLTDQLTRKLGWQYEDTSTPYLHQVSIIFGADTEVLLISDKEIKKSEEDFYHDQDNDIPFNPQAAARMKQFK